MKCYYCSNDACSKIGNAEGSMVAAFLPKFLTRILRIDTWKKSEKYLCRYHFEKLGRSNNGNSDR